MSTYAKIRALIPDAESAKTMDQVHALLQGVKKQAVRAGICDMVGMGMLQRTGDAVDGYRFHVIRAVKLKAYATPEESREAKRARDRERARERGPRIGLRKAGVRPLAEWREEQARQKVETAKRRADERAAMRQQRVSERAAIVRVPKPVSRPKRTQAQRLLANEPHQAVRLREAPPVKQVPAETIEQWMTRTGQRPQVLPVAWNEARGM